MRSDLRRANGALWAFAGLALIGLSLQAQHAPTRDPLGKPTFELLHSSSGRSAGIRSRTAADEVCVVDPAKELFIIDVSVVDACYRTTWTGDCPGTAAPATRGAWTFGRMMEGVFGTQDPETLSHRVRQWLKLWMEDQVVNGELVPARRAMRDLILRPWELASRGEVLDMKKAPFRLLAIVPRMDVGIPSLNHLDNLGEFRMVYGAFDEQGEPVPFTVIFEYKVLSSSCQQTLDNARAFHALSSMEFGPEFNAALQALTDTIVTPGVAAARVNGSNLLALRTNEGFLGSPHELRSFVLALPEEDGEETGSGSQKPKGRLVHHFQAETPAIRYQGTQTLADFITENTTALLTQTFRAPATYRGEPFLAGAALNDLTLSWGGPAATFCTGNSRIARRLLSVNTCQGCHGKDTGTDFMHVSPRRAGEPAQLSQLLTGPFYTVRDECNLALGFFDFQRRINFQCFLLAQTCPE